MREFFGTARITRRRRYEAIVEDGTKCGGVVFPRFSVLNRRRENWGPADADGRHGRLSGRADRDSGDKTAAR